MDYLIIAEGEKTEQNILREVLIKYGFNNKATEDMRSHVHRRLEFTICKY